jgi:hypothetical protein
MTHICKIIADDIDEDEMDAIPKKLVDVKAYVYLAEGEERFARPSTDDLPYGDITLVMTWDTYHNVNVGSRPVVIVGGKHDWTEDVDHIVNMAEFDIKVGNEIFDRKVAVIVTTIDMLGGLRDAFGFIVDEVEEITVGGQPLGSTKNIDAILKEQEFMLTSSPARRWENCPPKPIPLVRQQAIPPPEYQVN